MTDSVETSRIWAITPFKAIVNTCTTTTEFSLLKVSLSNGFRINGIKIANDQASQKGLQRFFDGIFPFFSDTYFMVDFHCRVSFTSVGT